MIYIMSLLLFRIIERSFKEFTKVFARFKRVVDDLRKISL